MMWYYEEWTALGRWSPRTEPSQPSAVLASGSKRKIRAVREVPENMTGYDLNVLQGWSDAVIAKEAQAAAPQIAAALASGQAVLVADGGETIVTLVFSNADASPRNTVIRLGVEAVPSIMAWYGAYYAGDRYTVSQDGRNVPMDQNGEPLP